MARGFFLVMTAKFSLQSIHLWINHSQCIAIGGMGMSNPELTKWVLIKRDVLNRRDFS